MKPLRVLVVDRSAADAERATDELRRAGWEPQVRRVEAAEPLRQALAEGGWDLVLAEWAVPGPGGAEALRIVRERGAELPVVLVAAEGGEERAVEAVRLGADDFVSKGNLARLAPAVERALRDAGARRDRGAALEAVAARDTFLSIASHELKTPLTSLQLQLQGLIRSVQQGGAGTDRVSEKIRMVSRSTERLGELVNRLLDVSRLTSGGPMDLVREEVDLAELAREVAGRFREAVADNRCELRLDAPRPVLGEWDRMRVETVVVNLLSNAVKYGQGRPVDLRVRRDGDVALLEVEDRGIGIAPEDQARIFGRFERAVHERHYGGFGLGLWISRAIAEEHGGRIRVESRHGQGSTFTLELPAAAAGGGA